MRMVGTADAFDDERRRWKAMCVSSWQWSAYGFQGMLCYAYVDSIFF